MDVVRIDYEAIDTIINALEARYEVHVETYRQLQAQIDVLENGAWVGTVAQAFFLETNDITQPALRRVCEALEQFATYLNTIKACFLEGEEAGRDAVEGGVGAGGSTGAGAGNTGGGGGNNTVTTGGQYTVQSGDTLWGIAQRYGVTVDELVTANQIQNRNLIHPGQVITIPNQGTTQPPTPPVITPPTGVNTPPPTQSPFPFAPEGQVGPNGKKRWGALHDRDLNDGDIPWNTPNNRSVANYQRALDYLNVDDGGNARYARNNYGTHCDTFVVDATRILNRPIPNAVVLTDGSHKYLSVQQMNQWLDGRMPGLSGDRQGPAIGWRIADANTALQYAQNGKPAIAISSGHVAMINPEGGKTVNGVSYPGVSQAGATNTYKGNVYDQFGSELGSVRYFVAE